MIFALILKVLIVFVALLHLGFMLLEMHFWQKPLGRKVFRQTVEQAATTAVLAFNQGFYNGILATGLLVSVVLPGLEAARSFQWFFLIAVVFAGVIGAATVSRRIFWVQAFPALLCLGFLAKLTFL